MTEFTAYSATLHPVVKLEEDYNNILDHAFFKNNGYLARPNGSNYELINGSTGKKVSAATSTDAAVTLTAGLVLGSVFVADGTYNMQSTLSLTSLHHLYAESRKAILKAPAGCADGFTVEGTEKPMIFFKSGSTGYDFGVHGFTIDTNFANHAVADLSPICLFSDHQRAVIENCYIKAFTGTNIAGLYDRLGTFDTIQNNYIENGTGASAEGIYTFLTSKSLFFNNTIDTMGREGFYISDATDGTGTTGYNRFIGNHVYNVAAEAFDIRSLYNIIEDNEIVDCVDGIYLTAQYNIAKGNQILGVASAKSNAIVMDFGRGSQSAVDCNVTGNFIKGYNRGIWVNGTDGAVRNTINSNTLQTCGTGLNIMGNAQCGCAGNNFYYCTLGVDLNGAQGNSITGGTYTNSGTAAVYTRANCTYNNFANVNAGNNGGGKGIVDLAATEAACTNRYTACWDAGWSWMATYGSGTQAKVILV